jgi:hypothetical protein
MGTLLRRWHISLDGPPPEDLPSSWATAVAAVSHDIRYRRHGRNIDVELVVWELTANANGSMYIGMAITSEPAEIPPFSGGSEATVDASAAQASVWVAEKTQFELTGYEFVQWPINGQRILVPKVQDGEAVWVDTSTNGAVALIGDLTDEPHVRD